MVFVTGATGLLGSHLIFYLAQSGEEVIALKRGSSSLRESKNVFRMYEGGTYLWPRIKWVEGDILEVATFEKYIIAASKVYHCAAMVSFNSKESGKLLDTNLKGTEHVASLCLQTKTPLIYVSSIAALGDAQTDNEIIDEQTPIIDGRLHSIYSESKNQAERIVWGYIVEGLQAIIVNPSIILGAGMWDRSSSLLFRQIRRGLPFYTKGVTGYVDVRDVCKLMIRLAQRELYGERFILNGGNYSYKQLFALMAKQLGIRHPWIYMPPLVTTVVCEISTIVSKLSGTMPQFTHETARTAHKKSYYSSHKIKNIFPKYRFYTLEETTKWIASKWIES